ncbi:glutathione S-transferase family protein [Nevskia ramosa]|uniref:glutathione S-transferase family protein n=1 Tax=Nevskia ramosa TaxID=64002 RepID=UPI0023570328|nr:glutathione S-transferase family protein [Nevskia ramosa]
MDVTIELHGAVTGSCLRASVALEEAGIPYRVVHVDTHQGQHRRTGYLALNPAGKIPVMVNRTTGTPRTLAQSNAIVLYAAERRPGKLLPIDDARARSITFERYFYFITDVIAVSHAAYHVNKFLNDSKAAIHYLEQDALDVLLAAERFVAQSEFMAGRQFTIADIAAFTITYHLRSNIDRAAVRHLQRWFQAVGTRAATQRGMRAFDLAHGAPARAAPSAEAASSAVAV